MDRQFLYALKANNFIISVVMIHKTNTGGVPWLCIGRNLEYRVSDIFQVYTNCT